MNLVVINLSSTGTKPHEGSLIFVGAQRIDSETGTVSDSLMTYVRPEPDDLCEFVSWFGQGVLTAEALEGLPSAKVALNDLARFLGEEAVIYHYGKMQLPLIRHHCERLNLPTRQVRFVDASMLDHELESKKICFGLSILAQNFTLPETHTLLPFAPVRSLQFLAQVARRIWFPAYLPNLAFKAVMPGRVPMISSTSI